jgi:NADH-quinone oxidoreductase subunit E
VVSFYNMFYDRPQGRHHAYVCTNLSCSLRGGRALLRELEEHLGVGPGQTTEDQRITLGHEECLGACAYAPVMRVDETYHEDLDLEQAKQILDELE